MVWLKGLSDLGIKSNVVIIINLIIYFTYIYVTLLFTENWYEVINQILRKHGFLKVNFIHENPLAAETQTGILHFYLVKCRTFACTF